MLKQAKFLRIGEPLAMAAVFPYELPGVAKTKAVPIFGCPANGKRLPKSQQEPDASRAEPQPICPLPNMSPLAAGTIQRQWAGQALLLIFHIFEPVHPSRDRGVDNNGPIVACSIWCDDRSASGT